MFRVLVLPSCGHERSRIGYPVAYGLVRFFMILKYEVSKTNMAFEIVSTLPRKGSGFARQTTDKCRLPRFWL